MMDERTCEKCKHDGKTPMEWPCINCCNNVRDHFEKETHGWISCSTRLPEDSSSVLVYTKDGGVAEGCYVKETWSWFQFRWSVPNADVIAWQPLPPPYKESED